MLDLVHWPDGPAVQLVPRAGQQAQHVRDVAPLSTAAFILSFPNKNHHPLKKAEFFFFRSSSLHPSRDVCGLCRAWLVGRVARAREGPKHTRRSIPTGLPPSHGHRGTPRATARSLPFGKSPPAQVALPGCRNAIATQSELDVSQ